MWCYIGILVLSFFIIPLPVFIYSHLCEIVDDLHESVIMTIIGTGAAFFSVIKVSVTISFKGEDFLSFKI